MNPDPTSTLRTCINGHSFHKSSDCPVCPVCENIVKPTDGFLSFLAAPARRALENEGITSLEKLSGYTQKELLKLHGLGKSSLPVLSEALRESGLTFFEKK
jgi:predicted RecB family nuclease